LNGHYEEAVRRNDVRAIVLTGNSHFQIYCPFVDNIHYKNF
jgi:hypothetical protein